MLNGRVIADIGTGLDGLAQVVERFLLRLFTAAFCGDCAPPDAILTIFIAPVRTIQVRHRSTLPASDPRASGCITVRA